MNGNQDSSNKSLSKIVSSIVGEPVKVYLEEAHTTENSKLDNQEERKRQAAKRLVEHFSNDFMVQMLTLDQYAAIDAIINE